jgi:uncharacterized protein
MVREKRTNGRKQRARKNPSRAPEIFQICWWVVKVLLAGLFLFSIGAVGYVIFFPTVIVDESGLVRTTELVFEEPDPPVHEAPAPQPPMIETLLPKVAIIIDDMGYHEKIGEELLALPLQLTFSFLPFAPFTTRQEVAAYASGHTVLLHLPLQSQKKEWDPGPGALFLGETEDKQREILDIDLSWVPHAIGVNNHMGSLYTENEQSMRSLLTILGAKGLFFVDSVTTPQSAANSLALEIGVKTARRQIFLDNIHSEEKIHLQLEKLVALAQKHGKAIGIGHPYPETLQALTTSIPFLNANVRLVGVQDLVQ